MAYKDKEKEKATRRRHYAMPANRAKAIASAKLVYARVREKLLALYGNKCLCCGESEPKFLEIDHVNGGGGKHFRSKPPPTIYREMIKEGRSGKYQLLCANCNRGKRAGGICPHRV